MIGEGVSIYHLYKSTNIVGLKSLLAIPMISFAVISFVNRFCYLCNAILFLLLVLLLLLLFLLFFLLLSVIFIWLFRYM